MTSENQTQVPENLVKTFEKKYGVKLTKNKVAEIVYLQKWNLRELVKEAVNYAAVTGRIVRVLRVFSLGSGRSIIVTVTPRGYIRYSIMLGFRVGLNRPNMIDLNPEDVSTLRIMLEQVEKISEELQEM